jgi:hypothetical protein
MMTAESRDFNVATYSSVSLIGAVATTCTFTGTPPGPCGAWLAAPPLHPALNATAAHNRINDNMNRTEGVLLPRAFASAGKPSGFISSTLTLQLLTGQMGETTLHALEHFYLTALDIPIG